MPAALYAWMYARPTSIEQHGRPPTSTSVGRKAAAKTAGAARAPVRAASRPRKIALFIKCESAGTNDLPCLISDRRKSDARHEARSVHEPNPVLAAATSAPPNDVVISIAIEIADRRNLTICIGFRWQGLRA